MVEESKFLFKEYGDSLNSVKKINGKDVSIIQVYNNYFSHRWLKNH